jgi:hypothetical protein
MGMRNAASVSDGNRRAAKCGLGASLNFLKLRQRIRVFCEFHLIHAERYTKRLAFFTGYSHYGSLAVDAFSPENRIFR